MIDPAAGILLIADPFLKDPNFLRTVVLLCEHRTEGSFGLVLNKQIDQTLDELVAGMEGFDFPVYYGGPVEMNTLHFIHQYPALIPDSINIGNGIYWGGNFESLSALIKNNSIEKDKVKFFVGYSGWSDGQLLDEMKEKSWLTVVATSGIVFNTPDSEIWRGSLQLLGGKYEQLINYPTDPQLN